MKSHVTHAVEQLAHHIFKLYGDGVIPLHRPVFEGNERQYLVDCVDSNFVSSVGEKVIEFEHHCQQFTGIRHAVATVNGTSALHIALLVAGVEPGDEVITQALTFIATCNAINYCGARPVFIDVDLDTMGLSPTALEDWLIDNCIVSDGVAINRTTGAKIKACVPMHTFGNPLRITEVIDICQKYGIKVVEDGAESLGSYVGLEHVGRRSDLSIISFNGNKIITTGGGGMILTDNKYYAERAKHLTTTAKIPHAYEFIHDEIGYNYRLPNLNAALGCAQMERLSEIIAAKAEVAKSYLNFCVEYDLQFVQSISGTKSNNWLNAIVTKSRDERDHYLNYMNDRKIMVRPIWRLMSNLSMYNTCQSDSLKNAIWLESRVVNLPSSVPFELLTGNL